MSKSSSKRKPVVTSGYVEVLSTRPVDRDREGLTVITMHYKDGFGRPKQFVISDHLMRYDQGQSHDLMIKRYMRERGINNCRVQYDDFEYRNAGPHNFGQQVKRLVPKRMRRTLKV